MITGARIASVSSLVCVAITLSISQEPTTPKKETPQVRPFVVSDSGQAPSADSLAVSSGILPKFDVPEYVITGNDALDLPNAVRPIPEASPIPIEPIDRYRITSPRDRRDILSDRRSAERQMIPLFGWNGRAFGSISTFTTPLIGIWVGMREQDYRLGASGEYGRTKGWQHGTDRSDASLGITGAYDLQSSSPLIRNTELSANLKLSEKSYRFYGSSFPDLKRNKSTLDLAMHARNLSNSDFPFELDFRIGSLDVTDSVRLVAQRDIDFSVRTRFEAVALPWNVGFSVTNSSVSGNALGSSSSFVFGGGTEFETGPVRTSLAIRILSAGGGRAARMTRIYPDIEAMVLVHPGHMLSISYRPDLQRRTLRSEFTSRPFLSANAEIQPTDMNHDIRASVRSDWNRWLETHAILGFQSYHAFPIDVDSARTGIWTLAYLPRVRTLSLTLEAVAKFTSFDYYSATIIVRTSSSVGSVQRVPYVPKIEGGLHYIRRVGERLMVSPRLFWMVSRTTDASASFLLPEYVRLDMRAEYALYTKIRCTLDIFNLLDRTNEWWDRYRERPLTVALGFEIRW